MNKLLTNTLLLGALSLSSISVFAQTKTSVIDLKPTLHANEKGNGGVYGTINKFGVKADFLRVRSELIQFLKSDTALNLYPSIDLGRTIELLENDQTFSLTQKALVDKFNLKRDALNFPENVKVFLEQESFEKAMGTKAIYVLVLHEVFGLQGIETNNVESSDVAYSESLKVWSYIHVTDAFTLKDYKTEMYKGSDLLMQPVTEIKAIRLRTKSHLKFARRTHFLNLANHGSPIIAEAGSCSVLLKDYTKKERTLAKGKEIRVEIEKSEISTPGNRAQMAYTTVSLNVVNMNSVSRIVCGFTLYGTRIQGRHSFITPTIKLLQELLNHWFVVEEIKVSKSSELD